MNSQQSQSRGIDEDIAKDAQRKQNFVLFLLASGLIGITQSIDASVINNFLNDTFHITVYQRTLLEIPREFPGFAVVFVSGLLFYFGDVRIASVANALGALGMLGLGFWAPGYGQMIAWLVIYSLGQHLFMPMSNSIVMSLSDEGNMGRKLGQVNGVNTAVFLIASLGIAWLFRYVKVDYSLVFALGALAFLSACILVLLISKPLGRREGRRFVFRREYSLFYILSILFGARKQIFITFGPWVLIKVFNQGVSTFAVLGFVVAFIGIFFKPWVGWLIDKAGERFVLAGEAVVLVFVCLGYAFAERIFAGPGMGALYLVYACFILDQLLTAASMARATYLNKTALQKEDVSPTLSLGISMDHIVAMFIPWFGGFIWTAFGYQYVFWGGAAIALLNLGVTAFIKLQRDPLLKQ